MATLKEHIFKKAKQLRYVSYVGFGFFFLGMFVLNAIFGYRELGMIIGIPGLLVAMGGIFAQLFFLNCPRCGARLGFLTTQPYAEKSNFCPSCGVRFDEELPGAGS